MKYSNFSIFFFFYLEQISTQFHKEQLYYSYELVLLLLKGSLFHSYLNFHSIGGAKLMYQILIHIAKHNPARNYRDIVNNFHNINIQNLPERLPRRTGSYLSRTCKIFPWIFPLAANVIIATALCVKPCFLSTKIEIITNRNSFSETSAWR